MIKPADHAQRSYALDPSKSFIVQAPAGSGKTELLTRRFLRLLSLVREPEEILAITFTRKAAAEMRSRIITSLKDAALGTTVEQPHEAENRALAQAALDQDRQREWNILQNPSRLKIRTIDSFCLYLAGRIPVQSGLGGEPEVTQDPSHLYSQAAENTLLELNRDSQWYEPLKRILLLLDNDWAKARDLIINMLELRDHWLRLIGSVPDRDNMRRILENHLQNEVRRGLEHLSLVAGRCLSPEIISTLVRCMRHACSNLENTNPQSIILKWNDAPKFPGAKYADKDKWLALRELLMTRQGEWRKTVTKNIGFPPAQKGKKGCENSERKSEIIELLNSVFPSQKDFKEALVGIDLLPEAEFLDPTWQDLSSLVDILTMAVGQLYLVMVQKKQVDYTEVARSALQALGSESEPSELLLRLDYQIQHILFDEFQDTSISQQEMLTRITSGWTGNDGRTIFLVGDPMQSIYAFRDADVGVFLSAKQTGIGQIKLHPLELSVNFRSDQVVVDWVNQVFPDVFHSHEDLVSGAVTYCPMQAWHGQQGLVQIHPFVDSEPTVEAARVLDIINDTRDKYPEDSIAVLVRNRSHLQDIVGLMRGEKIDFQAVEIEPLHERQVVLDLLSLTRALLRPGESLSWLSVLRAPWAGLDLKTLTSIVEHDRQKSILEKIAQPDLLKGIDHEALKRIEKLKSIIIPAIQNRDRKPLNSLVEAVWFSLGGPACLETSQEIEDAQAFFRHLQSNLKSWSIEDLKHFQESLARLYSRPGFQSDNPVQIMTVHKAKGLEFDTVIIPALQKPPRGSDKLMLQFMELPAQDETGFSRLLLAPIAPYGEESHPTYKYIENLKKERELNEAGRLLYVAVTRAKKRLHLTGTVKQKLIEDQLHISTPPDNTFAKIIWTVLEPEFLNASANSNGLKQTTAEPQPRHNILTRIAPDWTQPELPVNQFDFLKKTQLTKESFEPVTYHWAGDAIRHTGTLVHDLLRTIAQQGLTDWSDEKVDNMEDSIEKALLRLGVSRVDLNLAMKKVTRAIKNTINDPTGRWILDNHKQARNEYALSSYIDGKLIRVVMDRTFLDSYNTTWIIDYKTGTHEGGNLESFLHTEMERHSKQISTYRKIMFLHGAKNVRAGLYFPLLKSWLEMP
ncbi:UvrD-helicase domain-containing protein [Desulfonatronovibrio magnus]|uniref:UvrD-helicase domain-containing protein n=1 Tax=Desulfonatronovibrio magnus TaxID=698827 RepID=UPI0005EACA85|nr:UvrD-helicase domain-containing protein [Desulfonatronovibrio magnus]